MDILLPPIPTVDLSSCISLDLFDTEPNGGSTTTSLRQFRKKDVEKSAPNQQVEQQAPSKPMSESHVARVAPHNHYPAAPPPSSATNNDAAYHRYPSGTTHQFAGYSPQMKYSELVEPSQPNPISTSVIQKPKPKDYTNMDMCNAQPQHLSNHQQYSPDNGQYMHKDPSQVYPSGYHKTPESHYFSKEQPHQYQHQLAAHHPGMPKYNPLLTPSNMRKYNQSESPYINKLRQGRPVSLNDHPHLQDGQPGYSPMEQRTGMYGQQNHRFYTGSIPQPNHYSPNPNYPMNSAPHPAYANYPAGSCNYPRSAQMPMGSRYPYMERSMSPNRRPYTESMHVPHQMNYHPMHQKIASTHNYSPQYSRGPEYAQHYQHRRLPPDMYAQTCRPAQYMQSHPAPDLQELTESTVSPSDSLKKFIETWGVDEEPPSEISSVESGPIGLREKLRDDTPAGTVYMINASDVQYLENTGIPIVTSDNGGFQLTPENCQYLLKNGLISIESSGNQDRVVNLQIMEANPKSDCMLADKHIRLTESSLGSKPDEENSRRITIHQQAILNTSGNVVIDKSPQKKDQPVDKLNSTKVELVDKNCSPINLDHLEHNLGLTEPNDKQTDNCKTDSRSPNVNCSNDQQSLLLSDDLSQHSEDSQNQKSPESKSMPIIDFFAGNDDSCETDESRFSMTRKNSLTAVLNSFSEITQDKDLKPSSEGSAGTPTVIVTPESSRMEQGLCDSEGSKVDNDQDQLTSEHVVKKRQRIFSVDDIIGTKIKSALKDVHAAKTIEFLERERAYASQSCVNPIRQSDSEEKTIKVNNSSVVLELSGKLLRISVSIVDGKTVINVKPISDSIIVVDYNQNYQKSSEQHEEEDTDTALGSKDEQVQEITEDHSLMAAEEISPETKNENSSHLTNEQERTHEDNEILNFGSKANDAEATMSEGAVSDTVDPMAIEEPTDFKNEGTHLFQKETPLPEGSRSELPSTETNLSEAPNINHKEPTVEVEDHPMTAEEIVKVEDAANLLSEHHPVTNQQICSSAETVDLRTDSNQNSTESFKVKDEIVIKERQENERTLETQGAAKIDEQICETLIGSSELQSSQEVVENKFMQVDEYIQDTVAEETLTHQEENISVESVAVVDETVVNQVVHDSCSTECFNNEKEEVSSETPKGKEAEVKEDEMANGETELAAEPVETLMQQICAEQGEECDATVILTESDVVAEISEVFESETAADEVIIPESANDAEENIITQSLEIDHDQISLVDANNAATAPEINDSIACDEKLPENIEDLDADIATSKNDPIPTALEIVETGEESSKGIEEEVVSSQSTNNDLATETIMESYQEDSESEFASEDFPLEDEVFIEEPPAHELVVEDPLEGIGVIDGPNILPQSPEIPLEAVSTSETLNDLTEKSEKYVDPLDTNCNIVTNAPFKEIVKIRPEIQILSPTSTNVDDQPQTLKANVYLEVKRKYSTDNDISESSPSSTVTTKAAKKMYESDLMQVQHDIVSSSKKEAPKNRKSNVKRSKRLTERGQVKNEQKEMLKMLSEKRKRQKEKELIKQSEKKETYQPQSAENRLSAPPISDKVDEHDEEFVDFRELLRARKLKKLKKLQQLEASSKANLPETVPSKPQESKQKERTKSCCIEWEDGSSSKLNSETLKLNKKIDANCCKMNKEINKAKEITEVKLETAIAPQTKEVEKYKVHKSICSYEGIPCSTSNTAKRTEIIHSTHLKDPRQRSKSFPGKIMVPSVSELMEENSGSSSKKKITFDDYLSRKRKESTKDISETKLNKRLKLGYERTNSAESISINFNSEEVCKARDLKTSFVIHSSDWEDSNSPVSSPRPQSKEVCLINDFSGLIRNTCAKKPVIDLNELLPSSDKKLQEYKEKVDSQLSSLNIQIPKIKPYGVDKTSYRPNAGLFGSPKTNGLVERFLNDEKLTAEEMCKIRKIISYKRSLQRHSKNVKSPSKSPGGNESDRLTGPKLSPNPTYEVRTSEDAREVRLCLKRVASTSECVGVEKDSSSVTENKSPNKNVGYSVFNRLGEDGLPKIVFKRKMKINMLRQPVVELVKLDLDDLERVKEKYNVTVRQLM
ncbi:uncharacterized protein LOC126738282 isoform X2 [Anthonomus grandis grandis]|uniref:uncharacterized protein LOC126738282 isoform X2 n=1 Tax=Anthonomus grandis grandis TaxID=2921223 RepID=UPI0021668972|nr:uncharacterized protein LOC126738282 isoform X2 [Anthonomus grandis grandis]